MEKEQDKNRGSREKFFRSPPRGYMLETNTTSSVRSSRALMRGVVVDSSRPMSIPGWSSMNWAIRGTIRFSLPK